MYWPEYVKEGTRLIFREGRTKGIGRITRIISKEEEIGDVVKPGKKSKKNKLDEPDTPKDKEEKEAADKEEKKEDKPAEKSVDPKVAASIPKPDKQPDKPAQPQPSSNKPTEKLR
jgi:hypothetical protein